MFAVRNGGDARAAAGRAARRRRVPTGPPRLRRLALPALNLFDRQRLSLVRSLVPPPARLLDAGAGRGRFVAAARGGGYDAFGIEPSARGVAAATALGARVQRGTVEDAELEPRSVELVTLWHVLEHLEDPGLGLSSGSRPGCARGARYSSASRTSTACKRGLAGERWYHLDVPRHRTHFTPRGLHELLRARGSTL